MNIYISGISGTGMGPLALMAKAAGHNVYGSDLTEGPVTHELRHHGIEFFIGAQDGSFFQEVNQRNPIDWFVYTSALPANHPELKLAQRYCPRTSKRDQFIAYLVSALGLKMVAVAGTHGKTTTTAMLIWAAQRLGLPASYVVGTTLPFASAGQYTPGDQFFIYEADEYDRNFLYFHPWLSIITSVTYDHPDIYPTPQDYRAAFQQFSTQSHTVIRGGEADPRLHLSGPLRREDATSAFKALKLMVSEAGLSLSDTQILRALNDFPGAGRRFEHIRSAVYSDYAHHPEEISATLAMAKEEVAHNHLNGLVVLYQPHQNTRQHKIRSGYREAFKGVDRLFWLPTYLTREDSSLPVISPAEFIADLNLPAGVASPAALDADLASELTTLRAAGYLILLLTAGPADSWLRRLFI